MGSLTSRNFLISALFIFLLMPQMVASQSNNDIATGIQLFDAKKYAEAKKFFESYTRDHQSDAVGAYYLGRLLLREGNYEKSIEWLNTAARLDATNSDYHFWLGNAYGMKAQRAGLLKKASAAKNVKKHFEQAVELNPDNLDARMGLLQFYQMAPGIMGGNKAKAKEQAEAIQQRNPHQGHLAYGVIYMMNEEYALAEGQFQAAISVDPDKTQPYYSLGFLYARQKQFEKATELFENLLKTNPDEVSAYFYLGRVAVMSGNNLDKGEEYLKKYLQTESSEERPSFVFAHLLLGHIYKQKHNKELAKSEYEEALKLDPDFKQARKALEELGK